MLNSQPVSLVGGLVELIDRLCCRVVILEVDEGILVLHDNVSDLATLSEEVFQVVSCCAAGDASNVDLCEVWVVFNLAGAS